MGDMVGSAIILIYSVVDSSYASIGTSKHYFANRILTVQP